MTTQPAAPGISVSDAVDYFASEASASRVCSCTPSSTPLGRLPLGVAPEMFIRREEAERFVEEIAGDDPEIAAKLWIDAHELEAGG